MDVHDRLRQLMDAIPPLPQGDPVATFGQGGGECGGVALSWRVGPSWSGWLRSRWSCFPGRVRVCR